jgi:hypothetical protein
MTRIELTILMIIGSDCICKFKSTYHSIATIMPPAEIKFWNTDSLQKYKIKTRKSEFDFSRGHNSRDAVVGGFKFTYTIRSYPQHRDYYAPCWNQILTSEFLFCIFARNRCSLNNPNPQLRCRAVNSTHVERTCMTLSSEKYIMYCTHITIY